MQSAIYEGSVRHTRQQPVLHRFRYRLFMMYLDLDELPELFDRFWFWSAKRPALARFRRAHHMGDAQQPLKAAVCDLVEQATGARPDGAVRLLTNLSYFGYCFNPVSFYFCFSADGENLETIVAEVNNTPWGESDTYVLPAAQSSTSGRVLRFEQRKKMHVSPFMPMDIEYDWSFSCPDERLNVFMANLRDGQRLFDAALTLRRTEICSASLARVLVSHPFLTVKVVVAIYWQAFRLWLKRCRFYPHPRREETAVVNSQ